MTPFETHSEATQRSRDVMQMAEAADRRATTRFVLIIGLIALVVFTAHAWTAPLLDSPAVKAFVLSDDFWPAMLGAVLLIGFLFAAGAAAILFHPARLTGRTEPEGGL
jgi:hypothetical protein